MSKQNPLEKKAQKILEYLKSHIRYDDGFLPRPFFLEFTGSPSAGKTTTITELDKFLRRQGFRVLRPQEGAEVIRHISRSTPLYNLRTGLYALSLLVDLSHGHQYDVVIFDRCIFDAYCWMLYWKEKNQLTDDETKLIQAFFLSPFWTAALDAVFFMVCSPKTAMERELRIALSRKLGETTNPQTIKSLAARYRYAYKQLRPDNPNLHLIDTTRMDETSMVEKVAGVVMDALEKKALGSC